MQGVGRRTDGRTERRRGRAGAVAPACRGRRRSCYRSSAGADKRTVGRSRAANSAIVWHRSLAAGVPLGVGGARARRSVRPLTTWPTELGPARLGPAASAPLVASGVVMKYLSRAAASRPRMLRATIADRAKMLMPVASTPRRLPARAFRG